MKRQYCFLAAMMLWLFSAASFASIKNWDNDSNSGTNHSENLIKIEHDGHKVGRSDEIWVKAVKDHRHCEAKDDRDWGGDSWDHGHHGNHGHHGHHGGPVEGPPAAVPLPSAIWLFGSALLGLTGFKRKIGVTRMAG